MKKVSIGIVTKNREKSLAEMLDSVKGLKLQPFEVIIVENNSEKTLHKFIDKYSGKLNIRYFLVRKKGIAICRNVILEKAIGDIVSYVDDDCVLSKDWCNKMISDFSNGAVVSVVGRSGNYYPDNPISELEENIYYTWMSQYIDPSKKAEIFSGMFLNTRNLSLRLNFVRNCKMRFNDNTPFKIEDTDFGIRLYEHSLKRKKKMIYDPAVFILHKNSTNWVDFLKRQMYSKKGEEWLIKKYPGYEKINKIDNNVYKKLMNKNKLAKLYFVTTGFLVRQRKRIGHFLRHGKILRKIKS